MNHISSRQHKKKKKTNVGREQTGCLNFNSAPTSDDSLMWFDWLQQFSSLINYCPDSF